MLKGRRGSEQPRITTSHLPVLAVYFDVPVLDSVQVYYGPTKRTRQDPRRG